MSNPMESFVSSVFGSGIFLMGFFLRSNPGHMTIVVIFSKSFVDFFPKFIVSALTDFFMSIVVVDIKLVMSFIPFLSPLSLSNLECLMLDQILFTPDLSKVMLFGSEFSKSLSFLLSQILQVLFVTCSESS